MKTLGCRIAVLLSCMVLVATTTADAQKLRYKFKKGQKLHYEMTQNMKMVMNVAGQDMETDMKMTMDHGWVVKSVDAKGNASIETKVTRLRIEFDMQSAFQNLSFEYDSNKKEESDDFFAQIMIKAMKPLVGASTMIKISPRGKILEFKLSDEAKKALADAAPAPQGFGSGGFTEESLKSMAEQSNIVFPEGEMVKGKSWKNNTKFSMDFGEMSMEATCKYLGIETIDGKKLAKISFSPKFELKPKENAPVQFEMKSSEGKGTIYFDIANGRVHKFVLNQTMIMEMDVMGQKVEQDIDMEITMKLIEKKK